MKIFIFVKNKNYDPSSYYRIYQYLDDIKSNDIEILEYQDDKIFNKIRKQDGNFIRSRVLKIYYYIICSLNRYKQMKNIINYKDKKIIFIQREIFPRKIPIGLKFFFNKCIKSANLLVWDFDDNILESKEISGIEWSLISENANKIIVTSDYLRNEISRKFRDKTILIPTTDNSILNLNLHNEYINNDKITLIWVGTYGNLKHLENILDEINKAALELRKYNKIIILKVISNKNMEVNKKYEFDINNIKWDREGALKEIIESDIGLMPLISTKFTLGKAGFKAVQYIGCGIPAIVSDVGYNNKVILDGFNGFLIDDIEDWNKKIIKLSLDFNLRKKMKENALKHWNKNFNARMVSNELNKIFIES
ncbi:glycosyltransferase [Clostridium perfringens]|nr:glycosyltransferase [Clostridium perfringens]